MRSFSTFLAYLLVLALCGAGLLSACTSEQPAPSKKSSKEGKKGADDDETSDDEADDDDDEAADDEADDDDDEEGCAVKGGFGDSSGADLNLTLASVTWTADVKPFVTTNNCIDCHKAGGEAKDYATYEGAFKNVGAATLEGLMNEPKHADLSASIKDQTNTLFSNWHVSWYARGTGFDEFVMDDGAEYAALQEDFTSDVRFVFEEKCVLCHNQYNAATMPWATGLNFGDFTVLAHTTENILKRMNDTENPMPPAAGKWSFPGPRFSFSGADKDKIVAWFEANKTALADVKLKDGATTEAAANPCD